MYPHKLTLTTRVCDFMVCVSARTRACVCVCVRACARACMCVCARARVVSVRVLEASMAAKGNCVVGKSTSLDVNIASIVCFTQ